MSGDKERFLFEESMRGVEEKAEARKRLIQMGEIEGGIDVTPISDLRYMRTFSMSLYKNLEELYKDKSSYLEYCLSKLMEHCIHSGLVVTDDDGNYVNTDDGSYVMEDTRQ